MTPDFQPDANLANARRRRHHNRMQPKPGAGMMAAQRRQKVFGNDDALFDDVDALIALAQRSFTRTAKAEVADSNRRGLPTHGAVRGNLLVRAPSKAKSAKRN
jgi:hypothetical protein